MKVVISGVGHYSVDAEGALPKIELKKLLKKVPPRHGRLDEFSRLGLAAIGLTLQDANRDEWEVKRDIGLIASTPYGCLTSDVGYYDTVQADDRALTSPNLFAYTLPNCFVGEVSISYGLTGSNFVLYDEGTSQLAALKMAWDSLRWGESEAMLAGMLHSPVPDSVNGLLPLQVGATFFMLEEAARAKESYGEIGFEKGQLKLNGETIKSIKLLKERCEP